MSVTNEAVFQFISSVFLSLVAVVLAVIVLVFCIYQVVYYQHPDDPDQSWASKLVVVSSLWLVFYTPIFSAVDFAAVKTGCPAAATLGEDVQNFISGQCMAPTKTILYILIFTNLIFTYFIIPFLQNLRKDSLSKPFSQRFLWALLHASLVSGTILSIVAALWYFIGEVDVPINMYASGKVPLSPGAYDQRECIESTTGTTVSSTGERIRDADSPTCKAMDFSTVFVEFFSGPTSTSSSVSAPSDFVPYILSTHAVIGWFVLSIYGGVGLAAFPWRHISAFINRPRRPLTKSEHIRAVRSISERANDIKEKCMHAREEEDKNSSRQTRILINKLTREMVLLEQEERQLQSLYPEGDDKDTKWTFTVIGQWVQLVYGLVGLTVSVLWILQTYLYSILDPPVALFLNRVFFLRDEFYLAVLALLLLVFFCFHLTVCCIQGVFSVSMFFPFLPIYPLSLGTTMIDAFLYNCLVMLYSAPAILAFLVVTLSLPSRQSSIALLFGFHFRYLKVIGFLLESYFFLYLMMVSFGLTVVIGAIKYLVAFIQAKQEKKKAAENQAAVASY